MRNYSNKVPYWILMIILVCLAISACSSEKIIDKKVLKIEEPISYLELDILLIQEKLDRPIKDYRIKDYRVKVSEEGDVISIYMTMYIPYSDFYRRVIYDSETGEYVFNSLEAKGYNTVNDCSSNIDLLGYKFTESIGKDFSLKLINPEPIELTVEADEIYYNGKLIEDNSYTGTGYKFQLSNSEKIIVYIID